MGRSFVFFAFADDGNDFDGVWGGGVIGSQEVSRKAEAVLMSDEEEED